MIWGIASLVVILVLVVAELGLRFRCRQWPAPPDNGVSMLRPETNSTRWEDIADATRIVVFGDSIPYGWLLSCRQSYPSILEAVLRRTQPAQKIHVINSGVPGNTGVLGWMRLERDVLRYRPHLVLVGFGLNDANLARTWVDERREALMHAKLTTWGRVKTLLRKSFLLNGLTDLWKHKNRDRRLSAFEDDPVGRAVPRTSAHAFEVALGEITKRCRRHGSEVVLLTTTPISHRLFPESSPAAHALETYNAITRRVAEEQHTSQVDLCRTLDSRDDWEEMLVGDGVHLTPSGQQVVASTLLCTLDPLISSLFTAQS